MPELQANPYERICVVCSGATGAYYVEGEGADPLCRTCAAALPSCHHCERPLNPSNLYESGGEVWCWPCANDEGVAFVCSVCSQWLAPLHMAREVPGQPEPACHNCAGSYRPRTIESWDWKPAEFTVFAERGERTFGIELEVEAPDRYQTLEDDAATVEAIFGDEDYLWIKSDGSLQCGFELVTAPASLAVHRQQWAKFFERRPSYLRSHDTGSSGTCGLHVHVGRDTLSSLQIAKVLVFLNVWEHHNFIEVIARRPPDNNYAKFGLGKGYGESGYPNGDRFEALNLQNLATIEFRLFRGTLHPASFWASIEFADALCSFAAPAVKGVRNMTPTEFCSFVGQNRKAYPALWPYLGSRSLLLPEHVRKYGGAR